MKYDKLKTLAGDRASCRPVSILLPQGATRPPLRGLALLPDALALLRLKEDPGTLRLSRSGAELELCAIAQEHLWADQEDKTKGGWKDVRAHLEAIGKAAADLQKALSDASQYTCMALLRTGYQHPAPDWFTRLDGFNRDVSNALALVPTSNKGDAYTTLSGLRQGMTANEILVGGCQNVLVACKMAAGSETGGKLETLAKLVKRLALGADDKAGGIHAAAQSERVKGRSKTTTCKLEALWLIIGDIERRRGRGSDLRREADAELAKIAEGDIKH